MTERSEGYGRFPVSLITSGRWAALGHAEMAVVGVLVAHANRQGCAWPSTETIAKEAGVARGNVTRAIARLIEAGLLERVKAGGGRGVVSVYRVVDVADEGKNRRAGASESGEAEAGNRRAGAPESGEKLTRTGGETDARAHTNWRAGASGTYKEQKRTCRAPDARASERPHPVCGREDLERLSELRRHAGREWWDSMAQAGCAKLEDVVRLGFLSAAELGDLTPEDAAAVALERVGAGGGALVRVVA